MIADPVSKWGHLLMSVLSLVNAYLAIRGQYSGFCTVSFWIVSALTFGWGWFVLRVIQEAAGEPDGEKEDGDAKG